MRIRMMEAYLTVEATILLPLLLSCFVLLTYLSIYVYDRTLLYQDAYTMAIYAKEEYFLNDKKYVEEMDSKFAILKNERPYLSLRNYSMSLTQKENSVAINAAGDFYTPFGQMLNIFFDSKDRTMSAEVTINLCDPVKNMLIMRDLVEQ